MRILNISISDKDYDKFGLKDENLSFSELLEIINREMQKLSLRRSVELAEKYSLSKLSMDKITNEVKAIRKNVKNRS